MRELFLNTRSLRDEQGRERHYDYSIIIDEMDVGPYTCESYGLQVREPESGESCTVPHITCSISRIDELCTLVITHGVTPITLEDVVKDWL